MEDIDKVGGFVIKEKKVLVVRKRGQDFYISLGGKRESGETDEQCLTREVKEELGCTPINVSYLDTFEGRVHNDPTRSIRMACYLCDLAGDIRLSPEDSIEEYRWVDRDYQKEGIKIAYLMERYVFPALAQKGLL